MVSHPRLGATRLVQLLVIFFLKKIIYSNVWKARHNPLVCSHANQLIHYIKVSVTSNILRECNKTRWRWGACWQTIILLVLTFRRFRLVLTSILIQFPFDDFLTQGRLPQVIHLLHFTNTFKFFPYGNEKWKCSPCESFIEHGPTWRKQQPFFMMQAMCNSEIPPNYG